MADVNTKVHAAQGLKFQGLLNSPDHGFRIAGYDAVVHCYKVDAVTNTLAASVDLQTDLKIVHEAKIILPDGTGNASTVYTCKPGQGGKVTCLGLNGLAAGAVFVLVAIGARY